MEENKKQLTKKDTIIHQLLPMGIVCSTDDTTNDTTKDAANPYNFPAKTTTMEERNEAARLQRMEDRAMKEAMRASAQQQQQETIDNENVFVSSSDV